MNGKHDAIWDLIGIIFFIALLFAVVILSLYRISVLTRGTPEVEQISENVFYLKCNPGWFESCIISKGDEITLENFGINSSEWIITSISGDNAAFYGANRGYYITVSRREKP